MPHAELEEVSRDGDGNNFEFTVTLYRHVITGGGDPDITSKRAAIYQRSMHIRLISDDNVLYGRYFDPGVGKPAGTKDSAQLFANEDFLFYAGPSRENPNGFRGGKDSAMRVLCWRSSPEDERDPWWGRTYLGWISLTQFHGRIGDSFATCKTAS